MKKRKQKPVSYRLQTRHNGLWYTYSDYTTREIASEKGEALCRKNQAGSGYQIIKV